MDSVEAPKTEPGLGGHYLVAVSGSKNSEYLIRWTSATAHRLNAAWTALHIRGPVPETDPAALERNLELANRLGAEVLTIPDQEVAAALIRYARIKKSTALVIGKAGDGEGSFIGKRGIMESVMRESGDLDLIVLHGESPIPSRRRSLFLSRLPVVFRGLPIVLLALSLITIFGLLAISALGYRSISILYLLAIILLPFVSGRTAVLTGAVISALAWNFLFIPPRLTFSIGSLEDFLMFAAFFLAAFVGGYLTSRLKEKEAALSLREARMALLYGFTRALTRVRGVAEIADLIATYGEEHLSIEITTYLKQGDALALSRPLGKFEAKIPGDPPNTETAMKCFNENISAEDDGDRLYLPLSAPDSVLGILVVSGKGQKTFHGESRELIATLAGNTALALERELLAAVNEEHKLAGESERLARVLLNHVSHELRTPLTTIKGSISGLLQNDAAEDPLLRSELLSETLIAADKLNALVEDLLSMSRLETGSLRPRLETTDVAELLGAAQASLKEELAGRSILISPKCRDAEFEIDPALMVQVFRNILRNFVTYTETGAVLRIDAWTETGMATVSFADNGKGVPDNELPALFDTFYRGSNSAKRQGCGLGLAICRGIVEAHGGSIRAENIPGGGFSVILTIPRKEAS